MRCMGGIRGIGRRSGRECVSGPSARPPVRLSARAPVSNGGREIVELRNNGGAQSKNAHPRATEPATLFHHRPADTHNGRGDAEHIDHRSADCDTVVADPALILQAFSVHSSPESSTDKYLERDIRCGQLAARARGDSDTNWASAPRRTDVVRSLHGHAHRPRNAILVLRFAAFSG